MAESQNNNQNTPKAECVQHNWQDQVCTLCGTTTAEAGPVFLHEFQTKDIRFSYNYYMEQLAKMKFMPALPVITAMLKHQDRNFRTSAANALGFFEDIQTVEPLLYALLDEDEFVVEYAQKSLWRVCDKSGEFVNKIGAAIADESCHPTIRGFAMAGIYNKKERRYGEYIKKAFSSNHWYVRMVAANVLWGYFPAEEMHELYFNAYKNEKNNDVKGALKRQLGIK